MAEKREIIPVVQAILRVQSEPISLSVLIAMERAGQIQFRQLYKEIVVLSNAEVAPTSFIRRVKDQLAGLGLVSNPKHDLYELTGLGRESLGAFFEYRVRVLPAIIKSRLDTVEQHLGETARKELEEIIPPVGTFGEEPALMRLMRVQTRPSSMRVLAILSESANQSTTFPRLVTAMADGAESGYFAPSTLSDLTNEMEKEDLVRKLQRGKSIVLMSLGQVAVEAFFEYQERLKPAIKENIAKRLAADLLMDLGITP